MGLYLLSVALTLIVLIIVLESGIFFYLLGRPLNTKKLSNSYQKSAHYRASLPGMELMCGELCEDKYLISRDGLELHACLFPVTEKPSKFVLCVHGYKTNARAEFGPYFSMYQKLGYSVLLVDDRAHGLSQGKYIGFGVLDRLDCVDWANWIVDRYGDNVRILLHGISMGAATVLGASGEIDLPSQVNGIVEDCGYTSAWNIFTYQIRDIHHLPVKWILPASELLCRILAKYDFHHFTPIQQVRMAQVPILFIHGTRDSMVPIAMLEALYEACPTRKQKLIVEGAGHAMSGILAPQQYENSIREFFHI